MNRFRFCISIALALSVALPQAADAQLNRAAEQEVQALYEPYKKRDKTILEQVLNFATTGDEDGTRNMFWISGFNNSHKCMLLGITGIGGKLEEDLRQFNWTAFRMAPTQGFEQLAGNTKYTDGKNTIFGNFDGQQMDRLRKAWGIAANECPGKRSAF